MQVTASAPGKTILFGEHAVVYGKPAIAVAINRKANVKIQKRADSKIFVEIPGLKLSGYLELEKEVIKIEKDQGNIGILNYILKSLKKAQIEGETESENGMEITVDLEMPISGGLGSSAAVTVATLTAALTHHKLENDHQIKISDQDLERDKIASYAHQIEMEVQGAASPIDTTLSTYGGSIYLSADANKIIRMPLDWDLPLIIGFTPRQMNTGELIEYVKIKKDRYPAVINSILDSMEQITETAREALLLKDEKILGELMNINQGLLDALGVNTPELSNMIYKARKAGALGSKITGAGGGGSIIAYCPQNRDEVLLKLAKKHTAFPVQLCGEGVQVKLSPKERFT
ncbi:MAG: Mevalonate kinase [Methanobacterium sp. PtaU1.Bin242]|nr:MAG: Mevalonate kinase [Methanobacterium sp. PtaU1.Bin242]